MFSHRSGIQGVGRAVLSLKALGEGPFWLLLALEVTIHPWCSLAYICITLSSGLFPCKSLSPNLFPYEATSLWIQGSP